MKPRHLTILQRLADGERSFSYPTQELVDDLHEMAGYGWVRRVKTLRDYQQATDGWYLVTAIITEEGKEALASG
jgi:hypothetical protein